MQESAIKTKASKRKFYTIISSFVSFSRHDITQRSPNQKALNTAKKAPLI